jgi:hypothetical protein
MESLCCPALMAFSGRDPASAPYSIGFAVFNRLRRLQQALPSSTGFAAFNRLRRL